MNRMRADKRQSNEIRNVKITPEVFRYAEGSALIELGHTKVLCSASAEPGIPKWLQGQGQGWVTAEYGMLPRSTHSRISREKSLTGGRTQEISRLVGRSLRAAVDLAALGERQIVIDCDVIQADGGTRTAAVTGGFVALALCLGYLKDQGELRSMPLKNYVSAISVGLSKNGPILDLDYDEDSHIETDMNFVMTDALEFIEVQGTAEARPFTKDQMLEMMALAQTGCERLFKVQEEVIGNFFPRTR